MKISRHWLEDYVVSDKSSDDLSELFTQLGLECTLDNMNLDFRHMPHGG